MKKMENTFAVTGFVGKDASIHQFSTASVARFSLAISRIEKNGEENTRTSAFMNVEAWRKNENTSSFDRLVKGALLTIEGYFKPEEWQDAEGVKHSRVILVATKFYEAEEKEETPVSQRTKTKKDYLNLRYITSDLRVAFLKTIEFFRSLKVKKKKKIRFSSN